MAEEDPNKKLKYFVKHGTVKSPDGVKKIGDSIQLTKAEALDCDPGSFYLANEAEWAALQKKAQAEGELAKAEKAKAAK